MIYLIAIALIIAAGAFIRRYKVAGIRSASLDLIVAAVSGWLSGIFIGIAARVGMWSIPFFNGGQANVTFDGTLQVILVFSLYGIGLGVLYEFMFRSLLRHRGSFFGVIIALATWYPLGSAGVQQLNFTPQIFPLIFFTGLMMLLMFVPFSFTLEFCLKRWHMWHDMQVISPVHAK